MPDVICVPKRAAAADVPVHADERKPDLRHFSHIAKKSSFCVLLFLHLRHLHLPPSHLPVSPARLHPTQEHHLLSNRAFSDERFCHVVTCGVT